VPLKDTLKRVSAAGTVETTVPRESLWRVQTPQAFRHVLLRRAFQHAWRQGLQATDEAGLIEALGYPVQIVPSYEHNIKITTPDDLVFCATFLGERT
jgi:2-C-methyl-D-erythritol 4-phosphate cytidylyltransferase